MQNVNRLAQNHETNLTKWNFVKVPKKYEKNSTSFNILTDTNYGRM